jgi:hypothetical protein
VTTPEVDQPYKYLSWNCVFPNEVCLGCRVLGGQAYRISPYFDSPTARQYLGYVKVEQSDRHRGQAYSCWNVARRLYVVFRTKRHRQQHASQWNGPHVLSTSPRSQRRKEKWGAGSQQFSKKKKQNVDSQE